MYQRERDDKKDKGDDSVLYRGGGEIASDVPERGNDTVMYQREMDHNVIGKRIQCMIIREGDDSVM